jgi:L-fucose isomerase
LTEHVCLGDVAEMLMNDPYDWNGPKEPTICATEADAYAAVTMQLLKYVTGGLPSLFMDVRLFLPDRNMWDWCNSGNHSSWYANQSFDPAKNFEKITFHPALEFYFKAAGLGGIRCRPGRDDLCPPGPVGRQAVHGDHVGRSMVLPAAERAAHQSPWTGPHLAARARQLDCSFDEFLTVFPSTTSWAPWAIWCGPSLICARSRASPGGAGPRGRPAHRTIWERVH